MGPAAPETWRCCCTAATDMTRLWASCRCSRVSSDSTDRDFNRMIECRGSIPLLADVVHAGRSRHRRVRPACFCAPVATLRCRSALLRSWPDLLCTGLCADGPAQPARGRPALSGEPSWPPARARRYRARQKNVTHQGSPPPGPDDLVALGATVSASRRAAAAHRCGIPKRSHRYGRSWHCHCCGCRCPPFVRHAFLRRQDRSSRRTSPRIRS